MKTLLMICFALVLGSFSGIAQDNKSTQKTVNQKVEVYYFHFTRRCHTCESVEKTAKLALESLYAEKVKSGEYTFKALNLDDESSKALAKKLSVGGQSLLVVAGDKKIDMTDKGFMNSDNLAKMKEEMKKSVELALKK